jgi:hypothetical protein
MQKNTMKTCWLTHNGKYLYERDDESGFVALFEKKPTLVWDWAFQYVDTFRNGERARFHASCREEAKE